MLIFMADSCNQQIYNSNNYKQLNNHLICLLLIRTKNISLSFGVVAANSRLVILKFFVHNSVSNFQNDDD